MGERVFEPVNCSRLRSALYPAGNMFMLFHDDEHCLRSTHPSPHAICEAPCTAPDHRRAVGPHGVEHCLCVVLGVFNSALRCDYVESSVAIIL